MNQPAWAEPLAWAEAEGQLGWEARADMALAEPQVLAVRQHTALAQLEAVNLGFQEWGAEEARLAVALHAALDTKRIMMTIQRNP